MPDLSHSHVGLGAPCVLGGQAGTAHGPHGQAGPSPPCDRRGGPAHLCSRNQGERPDARASGTRSHGTSRANGVSGSQRWRLLSPRAAAGPGQGHGDSGRGTRVDPQSPKATRGALCPDGHGAPARCSRPSLELGPAGAGASLEEAQAWVPPASHHLPSPPTPSPLPCREHASFEAPALPGFG